MTRRVSRPWAWLALAVLMTPAAALAERGDRDKPVNLESDRMNLDEVRKIAVFDGNVVLIQGTLVIRGDRMVVTQDAQGFQRGVVTGNPARLRQKREGQEGFVDGEALRIEYDARSDKAEFFDKAWVRSGGDELRGPYISYDGNTETYTATGGATGPGVASNRVRVVIQPKSKDSKDSKDAPANSTGAPATPGPVADPKPAPGGPGKR